MSRSIREFFKPYQPSIAFSGEHKVAYEEASSCHGLKEFVYCYWRLHTPIPLDESFKYRVVSDGCIDILFEQGQPKSVYITGFSSKFAEYDLGQSFDYLGVRFLPTGFPAIFGYPANQLTNQFLPLLEVAPAFQERLTKALTSPMDLEAASILFDRELEMYLEHESTSREIDSRLIEAMYCILQSGGQIPLSQLDVGVSERQLRRLFEYYFGESPKIFARIIRFQNILGAKPSKESLKKNKIFYDEGYYDQAHFIKEFRALYGVTPNKAFGR